jgi:hypothetical protein
MPRQNVTAPTVPAETVPAETRATGKGGKPVVQGSRKSRRIQEKADKVTKSAGNASTKQPDAPKPSIAKKGSKKPKATKKATPKPTPEPAPKPTAEPAPKPTPGPTESFTEAEITAIYVASSAAHVNAAASAPVTALVVAAPVICRACFCVRCLRLLPRLLVMPCCSAPVLHLFLHLFAPVAPVGEAALFLRPSLPAAAPIAAPISAPVAPVSAPVAAPVSAPVSAPRFCRDCCQCCARFFRSLQGWQEGKEGEQLDGA